MSLFRIKLSTKDSPVFSSSQSIKTTIDTVKKLGRDKQLDPGLYYIVLIDLSGSTTASVKISPEDNKKESKNLLKLQNLDCQKLQKTLLLL